MCYNFLFVLFVGFVLRVSCVTSEEQTARERVREIFANGI